jgi:hypothetical protein
VKLWIGIRAVRIVRWRWLASALALGQLMEHGLRAFGRANVHPRRNPLDRQDRFVSQPGGDGQLAAVGAPAGG